MAALGILRLLWEVKLFVCRPVRRSDENASLLDEFTPGRVNALRWRRVRYFRKATIRGRWDHNAIHGRLLIGYNG
jgi:hypothetical protein